MAEVDSSKAHAEFLVDVGKKLSAIHTMEIEGRKYTRQDLKPIYEPLVSAISISTLSSLADLCTGKFRGVPQHEKGFEGFDPLEHIVHVVTHKQVQVVTAHSNQWKQRQILIDCNLQETTPFPLGKFLNQDEFLIALLSCCVCNDDRDYIARIAGNATAEHVKTLTDDGVTQQVGTRSGATLAQKETVKNIVEIQLYRTFREIDQPKSKFLFRLKQEKEENIPLFAFFEADGGAWKLQATESIARYLRAKLPETATVVS
jgi:hypothetical protein